MIYIPKLDMILKSPVQIAAKCYADTGSTVWPSGLFRDRVQQDAPIYSVLYEIVYDIK